MVKKVSDTGARRRLASAIHVRTSNEGARCFSPRHAIRATGGGRHVEVMICFECYQARVYLDGQLHHFVPDGREEPFHDQLLTAAGVALAQKGK